MIKIITDSTVYISKDESQSLDLRVIPMNYTIGGKPCFESYPEQNGNFEEVLGKKGKFTTSGPNPSTFLSAFEEELAKGNDILCITISSRLSGTYSAAHLAAKQAESKNIYIFDSLLTAGGMYILVKYAKKLINDGEKITDIINKLTEYRDKISIIFSVDDMTPLRNSGRIGFARLSVGTILNIKPILMCKDGVVVSDSIARGEVDIIRKLVEKIPNNTKEIVICYISNKRMATILHSAIEKRHPGAKISICKMGPVLAIHLGLQVIGVSFVAH